MAGLRAVARQTGLQTDSAWGPDAADVLWNQLSLLADRWLLVLDGVDDTGPSGRSGPPGFGYQLDPAAGVPKWGRHSYHSQRRRPVLGYRGTTAAR